MEQCSLPFEQRSSDTGDIQLCKFKCTSDKYLNDEDECINSCKEPINKVVSQGVEKYCTFDCYDPFEIDGSDCVCKKGYELNDNQTEC